MKYIIYIACLLCAIGVSGQVEIIENHQDRVAFANTSYFVTGNNASLTLAPGFTVSAATDGTFEIRTQSLTSVPEPNSVANPDTNIYITFSDVMDMTHVNDVIGISGSESGYTIGSWSQDGRTLIFDPANDFIEGETISVGFTDALVNYQLVGLNGFWTPGSIYSWQFEVFERWTPIPDPAFEAALEVENTNLSNDGRPGFVKTHFIETMTTLDVSNSGIADMTGIEDFTALTNLNCSGNQLTSLNVSVNTTLTTLDCSSNLNLICIKVNADQLANPPGGWSKDPFAIYTTDCNTISTTYVPDNNFEQALIDLGYDNVLDDYVFTQNIENITSLNVSSKGIADLTGIEDFTALTYLYCHSNQLTSLDVSENIALIHLYCHYNLLTDLNISGNTALTILWCYSNQLTSLDVSTNTALTSFRCYSNQLISLDVSANTALTTLYCNSNPDLNCVQVNATQLANPPDGWYKDSFTPYAIDCNNIPRTYVPDDNFEQVLIDLGYDNVLDDYVFTDYIKDVTSLDVSSKGIADLTGIEDFTALTYLYCDSNQLTSLDVSANTALTTLWCYSNQLTSLDVSGNTELIYLSCDSNQLTSLNVSGNTALTTLSCNSNQLNSLDVSGNTALTTLYCYSNQLTSLDVSANIELTTLNCSSNQLTSLDISGNTALTTLYCSSNQLTNLDVSGNTALTTLYCNSNQLNSLDVSGNTALTTLYCYSNQLSILDVSGNTALTTLYCSFNQLSILDVSGNTALTTLYCSFNQLSSLDISGNIVLTTLYCNSNQLSSLDVSGNTALTTLYCNSNLDLNCVQVNATQLANPPGGWYKDSFTPYAIDCNNIPRTYVPDDNFEQALIDLGYDNVLDDYVFTAYIEDLTSLDVHFKGIVSLTGIEDFTDLTNLNCSENQLSSLDVSGNTALTTLWCDYNQLSSLDVSGNSALTTLYCNSNQLTNLDISGNTALTTLWCNSNQLSSLDVSGNSALTTLYCNSNQLSSLDVSGNTALTSLRCYSNQLTSLDVSGNTALTTLYCNSNQLTSLDVSGNTALTTLYCNSNQLSSLDISGNIVLTTLWCYSNQLSSLDVSGNSALTTLWCYSNQLSSLDVSGNSALTTLWCSSNQLSSLDVSGNTALTALYCYSNPDLSCIQVNSNQLASPPVGWSKDNTASYSEDCGMMAKGEIVSDIKDTQGAIEIEESFVSGDIIFYPNPAKDQLHITLPAQRELVNVAIYAIQGEQVATTKSTTVSVATLAAGVYFVEIQLADGERITKKVIISRN